MTKRRYAMNVIKSLSPAEVKLLRDSTKQLNIKSMNESVELYSRLLEFLKESKSKLVKSKGREFVIDMLDLVNIDTYLQEVEKGSVYFIAGFPSDVVLVPAKWGDLIEEYKTQKK